MTLAMRERDLQSAVIETAGWLGFLTYHTHDSRRSQPGFPDLTLVHPVTGRLIFAELKAARGHLTTDQRRWLDALRATRAEVYLWRPADWTSGVIRRVLCGDRAEASA